ncbi:MAG: hypothetical protein IJQ98_11385 [Oscillospiraceae bacterium]|nr:hypothetical protein [Oscillospiraceae bacterium]
MNITINRSELSDAVSRAAAIAPASSPVRELEGVMLETDAAAKTLTVTATNLEIALEQRVPCETAEDDALVVNASLFDAMLKKLAGDTAKLHRRTDDPYLTIEGGEAAYCLPALERKNFPNMEVAFPEDTISVTGIPAMVRRSAFAVSAQGSDPLLKCVNLRFTKDGLVAVGSDGLRLVSAKGDQKSTGNVSLLVPAASLNVLARISSDKDEYRVGTTGKKIVFSKPNLIYSARIVEEEYVDTDRIISYLQNAFTVLTDISELRNAMDTVMPVDPGGSVCLSFNGDRLTLAAKGAFGSAATTVGVTPLRGMPQGQYWQTSKKLYECFKALSGTATLGVAQNGILTLSTEEAFYMQPSVRPPKPKAEPKPEEKPEAEQKKKPAKRRAKKAA